MNRVHKLSTASLAKRTTFSEEPVRSEPAVAEEKNDKKVGASWLRSIDLCSWLRDVTPFEWDILLASTCFKLLLFPA